MFELFQIFYEPGRVFKKVRDHGLWLPAWIASILIALLASVLVINMVGMRTIMRKQLEEKHMEEQKMEETLNQTDTPVVKVFSYAISPVIIGLGDLVIALVLTGALAVIGGKNRFTQVLGATTYALFPFAVLTTVMSLLILMFSADKSDLDLQNLIALNLGPFIKEPKPLHALATSLDLVVFGQIGMLSFGLSKVSDLPFLKCLMTVVLLWAMFVVVKVGWNAIF